MIALGCRRRMPHGGAHPANGPGSSVTGLIDSTGVLIACHEAQRQPQKHLLTCEDAGARSSRLGEKVLDCYVSGGINVHPAGR